MLVQKEVKCKAILSTINQLSTILEDGTNDLNWEVKNLIRSFISFNSYNNCFRAYILNIVT